MVAAAKKDFPRVRRPAESLDPRFRSKIQISGLTLDVGIDDREKAEVKVFYLGFGEWRFGDIINGFENHSPSERKFRVVAVYVKDCDWGVEGWVRMHSGVYNRVGGHPNSLEHSRSWVRQEPKLSMNPFLTNPSFNYLGNDGIDFYETISTPTETHDTISGAKWKSVHGADGKVFQRVWDSFDWRGDSYFKTRRLTGAKNQQN